MADPTFTHDVKPLFRDKDRSSMLTRFDLWSFDDVRNNASAILGALQAGRMPCDRQWSSDHVDLFRRWTTSGMAE